MRRQGVIRKILISLAGSVLLPFLVSAQPPIAVVGAKSIRQNIIVIAARYLGVPYLYGGEDPKGFDCSGLVYRVFSEAIKADLPRTTKTLFAFAEPIERRALQPGDLVFFDTTSRLAHVGIYIGEDRFIHSASEGPRTGVIESSLFEPYWKRTFAGAGRVLTPAGYLGLLFTAGGGGFADSDSLVRGIGARAFVAVPVLGLEPGLQIEPNWDFSLGIFRLPVQFLLGIDEHLRVYAGPALTLGIPRLTLASGERVYQPSGGILASLGVAWTPFKMRLSGREWRLVLSVDYDRYLPAPGFAREPGLDAEASFRAGLFVETGFMM